jgi:hypothetical protein
MDARLINLCGEEFSELDQTTSEKKMVFGLF